MLSQNAMRRCFRNAHMKSSCSWKPLHSPISPFFNQVAGLPDQFRQYACGSRSLGNGLSYWRELKNISHASHCEFGLKPPTRASEPRTDLKTNLNRGR